MERRENDHRQSSLPSSLIPHLFTAPQQPRDSSTRTTLVPSISPSATAEEASIDSEHTYMHVVSPSFPMTPLVPLPSAFESRPSSRTFLAYDSATMDHHDRRLASGSVNLAEISDQTFHRLEPSIPSVPGQRFASPIYSDPVFHASRPTIPSRTPSYTFPPPATRENVLQRTSWREGEAGPSSLLPPLQADQRASRGRRGSSQPARLGSQADMFSRRSGSFDRTEVMFGDVARREGEKESYLLAASGSLIRSGLYGPPLSHSYQGLLPPLLVPSSEDPFGQPNLYSYPTTPLNIASAGTASTGMRGGSPGLEPMYPSETRLDDVPSAFRPTEYASDETSQKGKKRRAGRADSVETDDNPRKSRNPRKTAVACNFCRGRKLRCNGAKPSCYNCTVRKFECEYVPIQRRRGPGKAPKGTRAKKGSTSGRVSDPGVSSNAADRRPSTSAPSNYPLDILVPELRLYTSVMSLDKFSFQPPDSSPPYPSAPIPERMREIGPRAQTPRSRETSSEDGSDAEEFYRKMR